MSRLLGIGACQIKSENGNVKANLERFEAHIEMMKLLSPWINLVVTNELALTGNVLNPMAVVEDIPGPITEAVSKLAKKHNVYIVPGSMYERHGDHFYNTSPVIDPNGKLIAKYHKMYPWRPYETSTSGNETVVFEIPGVCKLGMTICYDIWFPELIRDLVWKGAEVILHPTATYTADRRLEFLICQSMAVQNQCYIVDINGMGDSGIGKSMLVDPEGNILQETGQTDEIMMAVLDLDRVDQARKFGTYGVAQVLSSYLHENHKYGYFDGNREKSPLYPVFSQPKFHKDLK